MNLFGFPSVDENVNTIFLSWIDQLDDSSVTEHVFRHVSTLVKW